MPIKRSTHGTKPLPPGDFSAQRRELDVGVRIRPGPARATPVDLLNREPRVARQNLGGRAHVEHGAALVDHDGAVADRPLFAGQDGVGADDARSHAGSVSQS